MPLITPLITPRITPTFTLRVALHVARRFARPLAVAMVVAACQRNAPSSLAPAAQASLAEPLGWFDAGPGHQLFITRAPKSGLRALDFDSLQFTALTMQPDSSYSWSPGGTAARRRVVFVRNVSGHVAFMEWTDSLGGRGTMPRATTYPFDQEFVRYRSSDSTEIAATMLTPHGMSSSNRVGHSNRQTAIGAPGVVIVHGSGTSDRDNVWAYQFATAMARSGIVVLFPDKRGSGASTGNWRTANFNALAEDALAGMRVLRAHAQVDSQRVGVLGLSQGGWIAPLAGTRGNAAFIVDISGAAVTPFVQVLHETEQDLRKAGVSGDDLRRIQQLQRMGQEYARTGGTEQWRAYATRHRELSSGPLAKIVAQAPSDSADGYWKWWRGVGDFDPLPLWRAFSNPALVIYGEDDERDNVPVAQSVELLRNALRTERQPLHQVRVFSGTGHALGDSTTGGVRRDVLHFLTDWIARAQLAARSTPPS